MKYLKQMKSHNGSFHATFTNRAETTSYDAACFFMVMGEKDVEPADIESYVRIGELTGDLSHDYKEIRRIAATFTKAKGAAA